MGRSRAGTEAEEEEEEEDDLQGRGGLGFLARRGGYDGGDDSSDESMNVC